MKIHTVKIVLFIVLSIFAFTSAVDYYSNANKHIFVFPEYASLAGSNLAFSRDATQVSNPANLPLDTGSHLSLAYSGYFENAFSTSLASFVTNINETIGFGLSTGYLYVPDIEITADMNVEEFIFDPHYSSSSEMFLNFSLGYIAVDKEKFILSVGGSLHCMRRRLIKWTGYGIGFDVGTTFLMKKPNIRLTILADDITTNYIHWSSSYHDNGLPHVRFGAGWKKNYPYIYGDIGIMFKSPDLLANEGLNNNVKKDTAPEKVSIQKKPLHFFQYGSYGFEYVIQKVVALHVGFDESKRTFFGAGLHLLDRSLAFNFAYMMSYDLPGTYSLSSSYQW